MVEKKRWLVTEKGGTRKGREGWGEKVKGKKMGERCRWVVAAEVGWGKSGGGKWCQSAFMRPW